MTDNEVKQFKEFLDKLKELYKENRVKLRNIVDDEELKINVDFHKCMKIAQIMMTAGFTQQGMESLYALASDLQFDIEKFLDQFDIKFDSDPSVPPIVTEKDEIREDKQTNSASS